MPTRVSADYTRRCRHNADAARRKGQTRLSVRPYDTATRSVVYFPRVQTPEHELTVVLAEDHHFFREGLRGMLEADGVAVVGEASSGERAIALVRELAPAAVVMDLKLPNVSGVEAIRRIASADPDVRIIVLTVSTDGADVIEALAAGACGYMPKDAAPEEVLAGIRLAVSGRAVLPREVARMLAQSHSDSLAARARHAALPELTGRELEVIRLLAVGADNGAIGRELALSPHTVKRYVTNILEKLGVSSRVEAAVYAVRNGLA